MYGQTSGRKNHTAVLDVLYVALRQNIAQNGIRLLVRGLVQFRVLII